MNFQGINCTNTYSNQQYAIGVLLKILKVKQIKISLRIIIKEFLHNPPIKYTFFCHNCEVLKTYYNEFVRTFTFKRIKLTRKIYKAKNRISFAIFLKRFIFN